ncbi:MAG: hypothetical protein K2N43_01800, partial [Lachnospiraceae bacterium]|nr:hypothetical protein [Lachnospiraceae bacterium]
MLTVLLSWVIIGGAALIFGKAITDSVYGNRLEVMGRPDIYIVTGVIFLNIYAQFFSLFYKVAGIACTILGTAGIILVFVCLFRRFRQGKNSSLFPGCAGHKVSVWRIAAVFLCFVLTLLWTTRSPGQYDTGLYHAQAIHWVEEYGVVPGLGNLHMRLAYNSAFMCLQALFSLEWLAGQSLHSLNGFFCLAALVFCFSTVRLWGERSLRVSDLLKCVMAVYVVQKSYDIASSGTDIEAMLLILYIFVKWSEYQEAGREDGLLYGWLCLVSVYAATVKLSAAAMVILALYPLYLFVKEKSGKAVLAHVAAGLIILAPWLIRNVIISGYLVYPYAGLDLFQTDWKMDPAVLAEDSLDIKMYARGIRNAEEYDTSLFGWVWHWFLSQSMGERIVLLAGVICIPLIRYLLVKSFREKEYGLSALLSAGMINLVFWFFSAPHMRYGGPYIYAFVVMALGTLVSRESGRRTVRERKHVRRMAAYEMILRVAPVAAVLVFSLQYGKVLMKIPEMEAQAIVRQPDYLAWPATQYPVDNVHIWMPDEG